MSLIAERMWVDWKQVGEELDAFGCAIIRGALSAEECGSVAAMYDEEARFRSRVVMARHGFGRGEYKYFGYPLPELIASVREELYPALANVANRWNESLGIDARF